MKKIAIIFAIISLLAGFMLMTVKVDTQDTGGLTGTLIMDPNTPQATLEQTRNTFRSVGVALLGAGLLSLAWARSKRKRS